MFLQASDINAVYIYIAPVDFRKGIVGLGSEVNLSFGDKVSGKNLFVFTNRRRDKIRILYWDDTGFALWHKVLEAEKFRWPSRLNATPVKVTAEQLQWLLCGLSIDQGKPHTKLEVARHFY